MGRRAAQRAGPAALARGRSELKGVVMLVVRSAPRAQSDSTTWTAAACAAARWRKRPHRAFISPFPGS
jgi:hypothetical protein